MQLIIQLLGFPYEDYGKIKNWCVYGVATQSGIATPRELTVAQAELLAFIRYCWHQFNIAKQQPRDDLSAVFVRAALTGPGQSHDGESTSRSHPA